MEMVNLRFLSGAAKVVGVLVCMAGCVTIGLYKGPRLKSLTHHHLMGIISTSKSAETHAHTSKTWIGGSFLMLTSNILWGFWLVLQVSVLKSYPSKLLFTTMQCLLSTIQSFFVAIAFERNPSQWKLSLDIGLLAILYSGVVATGVSTYLITWCIEKKGAVFLAIFTPLSLIITMVCSTFLFGEVITLGSVIGGVLLVGGLYSVLWGKRKDELNDKLVTEEKKECPQEKEMA